jgi:hypothetical protein
MNSDCAYAVVDPDPEQIGVVSSSIPLPPPHNQRQDTLPGINALLRQLKVGDSVLLPRREREGVYTRAKFLGIRISTRVADDTVRVWRTE